MPPALSDDESSASETEIPFKNVTKKTSKEPPAQDDDEEEEEEPEEQEEQEYKVERIISHKSDDRDRTVKYEVKWDGFHNIADRTWEPKENLWDDDLECPIEQLQKYWDEHCGGVEPRYMTKKQREKMLKEAEQAAKAGKQTPKETPKAGPARKRKLSQSAQATPTATETKGRRKSGRGNQSSTPQEEDPPARKTKTLQLPPGSWENQISGIDTIEEQRDEKTGTVTRYAYVGWVDPKRKRSKHSLEVLRVKCPQRMLDYYEQHLVFNPLPESNGDTEMKADVDSDVADVDSDVFMDEE